MLKVLSIGHYWSWKTTLVNKLKEDPDYWARIYLKDKFIKEMSNTIAIKKWLIKDWEDISILDQTIKQDIEKQIISFMLDKDRSKKNDSIIVLEKDFYQTQDWEEFGKISFEDIVFSDVILWIKVPGMMLIDRIRKTWNEVKSILNSKKLDEYNNSRLSEIKVMAERLGKPYIEIWNWHIDTTILNIINLTKGIVLSNTL